MIHEIWGFVTCTVSENLKSDVGLNSPSKTWLKREGKCAYSYTSMKLFTMTWCSPWLCVCFVKLGWDLFQGMMGGYRLLIRAHAFVNAVCLEQREKIKIKRGEGGLLWCLSITLSLSCSTQTTMAPLLTVKRNESFSFLAPFLLRMFLFLNWQMIRGNGWMSYSNSDTDQ